MRRLHRALVALLTTALLCGATPSAAASTAHPTAPAAARPPGPTEYREVDAYLRERTESADVPGAAYAIVDSEGIARVGAWGHDGNDDPVTRTTPFLWGSIAKPVTATAVLTLVEDGALDLDARVRAHLPDFAPSGRGAERITLRHLLEQTSGLPEITGATDRFSHGDDPYGEAVARLDGVELEAEPGERFGYSSANYLLLGAVVERVSGESFETFLRKRVLDPLGMDGAVTSPREARASVAGGHGYAFGRAVGVDLRYDATGASYGYLGGTVEDLARFAMAHLGGGAWGGTRVLSPESVALAHRGTARVNDNHDYGLGWREDRRNEDLGVRTVWHGGAAPGYQAAMVLLPDLDRAVVVLQNVYGSFQDAELLGTGLGAARILAGGEPEATSGDPLYPVLLTALAVPLGLVVLAVGWTGYRLLRPRPGEPRGWPALLVTTACWVLGGLTVSRLSAETVPALLGAELDLVRLYAPDVGWLLVALMVAGPVLAAARLALGVVTLLRSRRSATPGVTRADSGAGPAAVTAQAATSRG